MKKSSILKKGFENILKDDDIIKLEYSLCENIQKIGKGGFSTVYSAVYNGEMVALKRLDSEEETKEVSKEFIKELKQLLAIKSHPNINQCRGITQDPKTNKFILILQFANGGNLRQHLQKKWHENIFKISLSEIIDFARQITHGLEHLHKNNIIHCDLHPKNILMNCGKLLIADFGLSRKIDDTYSSTASIVKGVPAYLDPYIHREPGKKPDEKSDIYSLGVIFWELTSGVAPFANAISGLAIQIQILKGYREQTIPGTPNDYAKLYKKCWNAEPDERPKISQILDDLYLIPKRNTILFVINRNKQLRPELENNVHNDDDLTKTLLKEASVLKPRRPTTKTSNESSGRRFRELSLSSLKSSGDSLTRPLKEYFFQTKLEKAEELKSQGQIYYISGNYKESLKYLKNSLSIDPNDADALRFRGETYFKLKKYQKSLADFNKSIYLESNNAVALRSRGKTYYVMNCYKESLEDLTKSLAIESDNAIALRTRGQAYYMLNHYENSLEDLTKSLEIDPNDIIALKYRGQTYYMLKHYKESCADLAKSLEIDPNDSIALRFLGQSYFELKRYEESSEILIKSVNIDSKDAVTLEYLGKSHLKQKKYKESLEYLTKSLKFDSKNFDTLRARGQARFMNGDYNNSLKDLNSALKINPNDAESLRARGKTHHCLENYEESLEDLNKSLIIEPNHPFALRTRGETYYKLNNYYKSLNDLNKSIEFEPDNTFTLKSRGQTYYALKLYKKSLADLNKLNEIQQNNAVTLRFRGEIYYILKQYKESLEELTKSLEIDPANSIAYAYRGLIFYNMKRYEESLDDSKNSLEIDSRNTIALRIQGQSCYKLEKYEESVKNLTKLLDVERKNVDAFNTRAQVYYMLNDYKNSLKDLNNALNIDPHNAESLRFRGLVRYNLGKYIKSINDLTKSLDIEPNNAFALRSRALTYYILKRYNESLADLNKSITFESNDANALSSQGKTYYMLDHYEDSLAYLTTSLKNIDFFMKDKAHIDSDVKRIETSELSEPLDNKYTLEKLKEDQESVEEDVQREANRWNAHINWIQGVIKKYNLQEIPYLENKKRLVRGGFGTVYRARSSLLGGYVAIKVVESDTDEKAQKLFENELKQHSRINHERIIKFYGISLDMTEKTSYLVMEYANNGNLREYLGNNELEWAEKIRLTRQIAEGISYLHKEDITHHDLHTLNILIHKKNVKISDFGFSKKLNSIAIISSKLCGVIPFIDPCKLANQDYPYDKKSDIYSIGVLMWEISSNGRPPFNQGKNPLFLPLEIIQGLRETPITGTPKQYIELYSKCWDHEPKKRPLMEQISQQLNSLQLEPKYDDTN